MEIKKILIILAVLVVLGAGVWYAAKQGWIPFLSGKFSKDSYQAVFLSNGQVYFGKIKNITKQYATMTDIFYLILKRPLQEQTPAEGEEQKPPEYTLIKLGQELHGPIDKMVINRDHILFIEELKSDGKVGKAISDFKAGRTQK